MTLQVTSDIGLDYILSHFEEPIFPRTYSTKTTENHQYAVYSREEALARFKQADFLDCKINAYPNRIEWKGLNRQAPNFIFIDLDLGRFKSRLALDRALTTTLKKIKEKFNCDVQPTVLWSGNGYHIYLPVNGLLLELESVFAQFETPSRKFIQFAEQFLSDNKADPCHSKGMSFKNCMIRIPGSINSKNVGEEVKIIHQWNGVRPAINWLLRDFRRYLIQDRFEAVYRPVRREPIIFSTNWSRKR